MFPNSTIYSHIDKDINIIQPYTANGIASLKGVQLRYIRSDGPSSSKHQPEETENETRGEADDHERPFKEHSQ